MKEVLYTRHGLTSWNIEGRLQGRSDIPLSTEGVEQVKHLGESLKNQGIELVVASPLLRTFETGKIIAEICDVPIETDSDLIERDFGTFEGLYRATLVEEHGLKPGQPLSEILPPDAEQLDVVAARVWPVIEKIMSRPEKILVISHAGVFRALWNSRINEEFSELKFGHVLQFVNNENNWSAKPVELN